jgi:hypothetical protein
MSGPRGIYFMKLNDLYIYDEEIDEKYLNQDWLDVFISVVSYVSHGCFSRIHEDSKLILYIIRDTGDIEDHPHRLPMEFISYNDIPLENIFLINHVFDNIEVNKKTPHRDIYTHPRDGFESKINRVKMDFIIELLIDAYTYLDTNGLLDQDFYTHITCSIFFNNISEYGLLVNPPVRIIDYDSDDEDDEEDRRRGKKGKKKGKKKKQRYDLNEEIDSLHTFTRSHKVIIPIVHGNELVFDEEYQEDEGNGYEEEGNGYEEGYGYEEEGNGYEEQPYQGKEVIFGPNNQPTNFFDWNTTQYVKKKTYPYEEYEDVLNGDDEEFNDFMKKSTRMDDDDDDEDFFSSFHRGGKRKTYKKRKTYTRKNK